MIKGVCYNRICADLSTILGMNLKRENVNLFSDKIYYIKLLENSLIRLEIVERGKFRSLTISSFNEGGFKSKVIVSNEFHENKITQHINKELPSEEEFFMQSLNNNLVFTYEQYNAIIEYFKNYPYAISVMIMLREKGCTCND